MKRNDWFIKYNGKSFKINFFSFLSAKKVRYKISNCIWIYSVIFSLNKYYTLKEGIVNLFKNDIFGPIFLYYFLYYFSLLFFFAIFSFLFSALFCFTILLFYFSLLILLVPVQTSDPQRSDSTKVGVTNVGVV